ncbi:MAG: hypothetical protein JW769_03955 [Parachlamydiales bacterium]|nr:hypothetical protein [Parachlamydiales bacterium]
MDKTLLVILIDKRREEAVTVQKILTDWGCMIKTRLGIHDGTLDQCSNTGLIVLELVGVIEKKNELMRKLNLLGGVNAKLVELEV